MDRELLPQTVLSEICGWRRSALDKMKEAVRLIARGHKLAGEAQEDAACAHKGTPFYLNDRSEGDTYRRIFQEFDPEKSAAIYREHLDACIWMHILKRTGMSDLMDKSAKEELYKDLCGEVPEVSEENAYETFDRLRGEANLIFQRGLARAFGDLDRRFKSHNGFSIGSRIILTHVFDAWGGFNDYSRMGDTMADIERVFAVLDGQPPQPGGLSRAVEQDRGHGWDPRQSCTETTYFRIRGFKNGNAHVWFKRDDLVEKANEVLADYYGEVLPDASPHPDEAQPGDLHSKTGLPAKNLSFYPTPPAVVEAMLRNIYVKDQHVLEPSAGNGNMARVLLGKGARVDAIEIDPERARALSQIGHPDLKVTRANFLALPARPTYSHVVMNPPFYGTHWMQHVVHAFDFLAPGGTLAAVLPISAELGQSKQHKAFRAWAEQHIPWGSGFTDLPAESFAESGTRINTVFLTLHKAC